MEVIFVGEERSPTAKRMGVRWEDGRLAAKQLFDAFAVLGFCRSRAKFFNLFERDGNYEFIKASRTPAPVIAMGKRVQKELANRGIKFTPLVHPAARGAVRLKATYTAEVRRALIEAGAIS